MDFGEAFDIFIGIRNGDIEAANAQFMSLKDNDPNQFIRSLVQIICDSTSSDKRKINAIKFLSVPLQRSANNTSEYRLAVFDLDLIKDILALLFSFFEYADEISVPSIECFIIYASSFKTGFLLTQIKYLFQSINNEIAVTFFEKLLYTIYKCLKWICLGQDVNIPQYFQIMNEYLENHEVTPKSRKYYVKIVKTLLLLWPPSDSQNQILSDTFSICWNYTLQFPQDGDKLWKMILPFNYFLDAIPNLPDLVYQSIMNSFDMWSLLSVGTSKICYHNHWDYILSEHEIDVINFVVNLLTQEVEEFDPKLIQTSVDAIVFAVRDNGPPREIIIQYISSHIEEVETKEKFVSIILLYSIVSCSNAEEFGDNFSEIIKSVLQESSELSIFYSIEMIGFAINKNLFVVDEEMIQIIGQFLNSESTKIVDVVLHTLSYLGGNQDSDIRQAVLSLLMGIVTNYENVETVSSCLRSLENYAMNIPEGTALQIIPSAMEIIQTLINEHIEDITVSPSIGFVCQLFVTAGPSSECYGSDLVNLASNLLDKEITENDGLHILQTVVKIFGSASTEIIQFTSNIVFENIRDSDNTEHLQILLQIANSIIPYLEDENALNFVLETTLEYLASNSITKIEHFYYYNILAAINNKIPDLIKQNATAIIENNIFIESGKKTNEYSQARLCLTCAAAYENEEENPLLSRWLCSIFHLLDNHFAVHPEAGTLCLSAIELIAAKCPSRMETIYKYPLNSPRYKKLESLLNNEEKQKLHEMVPPL